MFAVLVTRSSEFAKDALQPRHDGTAAAKVHVTAT